MNRRSFLTVTAAALAATALPAQAPLTEETALLKAQSLWGSCARVSVKTGAAARAANRPNGEYCIGWREVSNRAQFWYGDSWEDAFATYENYSNPIDPATGKFICPDPPGPNS